MSVLLAHIVQHRAQTLHHQKQVRHAQRDFVSGSEDLVTHVYDSVRIQECVTNPRPTMVRRVQSRGTEVWSESIYENAENLPTKMTSPKKIPHNLQARLAFSRAKVLEPRL